MQNTVDNSRIEQPKTLGPVWIRPEPPVGTVVDECPYFSSLLGRDSFWHTNSHSRTGTLVPVYTIDGTKKLLDRVKRPVMPAVKDPTTASGNWYATAIFWRPQVAFLVNEATLFPVLLPLAPATSIAARFPEALESILKVLGVNPAFIASERWAMSEASFSKTANRSVLGVMNRLELELDYVRDRVGEDLLELSLYLADHLVGPLPGTEFRTPQEKLMDVVHAQA